MIYDSYEKAVEGYSDEESAFYNALKIQPLILADCGFHNLSRYSYEVGEDCCEYYEENGQCPEYCEKLVEKYPCYPTFSDNAFAYYSYIVNKKNVTIKANSFEEYEKLLLLTLASLISDGILTDEEVERVKSTVGTYFGRIEL